MNQPQKRYSVILIGDDCLDEYHYGKSDRLSPEAPVPIFCPTKVETKNGMAANVKENLENLGVHVKFYHSEQSVKKRLIHQRTGQHLLRIDHDVICTPIKYEQLDFTGASAVVVSDYNKGTVTYELIEELQQKAGLPVFVDTKKTDLMRFSGCYVKINELEYSSRTSDCRNMIVTRGGAGVTYMDKTYSVPTVPVFDVCGAGDTFLSALVYKFMESGSIDDGIKFAIKAAGITVQHSGVYAPTLEEII
jgi:bifunctional ADP-heptose synthase (sugar kinase/adenylyltransferase)